ncbi:hypothetical protein [Thalassotalea sp. G2M2-11]|uniref:hypothetical protein n=1 Tax=Thalassotalea sp. G2M2-11 TaxID=2787627 RepID=UPI0019D2C68A|nr:hypothetical protein [Thalassotalea sp. G2M2-11]
MKVSLKRQVFSYSGLWLATGVIFAIAEYIRVLLASYEMNSMFVSFCAGFILFIPLVSLLLHPVILVAPENRVLRTKSSLLANIGIVFVVQVLFFLIWITDAIAMYSIYVDQTSFLAKAFNITSENTANLSTEFFVFNLFLAWFFALLSLVIGLLPCLIARLKNQGVVGNFMASFSYAKQYKKRFSGYSLLIAASVILPLLYVKWLFIFSFPVVLALVIVQLGKQYLQTALMS